MAKKKRSLAELKKSAEDCRGSVQQMQKELAVAGAAIKKFGKLLTKDLRKPERN